MSELRAEIVFVDVDDTLVRSAGSKRIPITSVAARVAALKEAARRSTAGARAVPITRVRLPGSWGWNIVSWHSCRSRRSCSTTKLLRNGASVATFTPSTSTASKREAVNPKPVEQARTRELALALPALRRPRQRTRFVIVARHGGSTR
jgi:hypothetical protein